MTAPAPAAPVGGAASQPLLPELVGLRRPRLRDVVPVLWRDATTIALGDRVVLTEVGRLDVAWLTSIDGLREPPRIEHELPIPATQARRLLRAALAATALEDAAVLPDAIRWAAPEDRAAAWGRLGAAVDTVGSVTGGVAALDSREHCTVSVVGEGFLADQVRAAVHLAGLPAATSSAGSITVLADLPHPDLPPAGGSEPDGPFLPVAAWGRRAVVGPVVVPGVTSCPRCAQLHHRDADPSWPLLAVQWSHAIAGMTFWPVDPLLAALAAAHAAQLARHWVDDPEADVARAIELTLPAATARWVPRPAHPLCGCRWTTRGACR